MSFLKEGLQNSYRSQWDFADGGQRESAREPSVSQGFATFIQPRKSENCHARSDQRSIALHIFFPARRGLVHQKSATAREPWRGQGVPMSPVTDSSCHCCSGIRKSLRKGGVSQCRPKTEPFLTNQPLEDLSDCPPSAYALHLEQFAPLSSSTQGTYMRKRPQVVPGQG